MVDVAENHAATLRTAILRASFSAEVEQTVPIRSSLVTTFAAKAVLHNLLDSHIESRRMAIDSIKSIMGVMEVITISDLDYMDPVIGVSALVNTKFPSLMFL
jgi:hypothetical protein